MAVLQLSACICGSLEKHRRMQCIVLQQAKRLRHNGRKSLRLTCRAKSDGARHENASLDNDTCWLLRGPVTGQAGTGPDEFPPRGSVGVIDARRLLHDLR